MMPKKQHGRIKDMDYQLTKKAKREQHLYTLKGRMAAKDHVCAYPLCRHTEAKTNVLILKGALYIESVEVAFRKTTRKTTRYHLACAGTMNLVEPTPLTTDQKNRRHAALLHTQRKVARREATRTPSSANLPIATRSAKLPAGKRKPGPTRPRLAGNHPSGLADRFHGNRTPIAYPLTDRYLPLSLTYRQTNPKL